MKLIFFSKICLPQLLAPLHLIFCAASLCQDNSSESSPIMVYEVGEHMARDLRQFLHTVSADPSDSEVGACGLSSSAHPTDFLWGLGRGTVMAMAKPLFCGR